MLVAGGGVGSRHGSEPAGAGCAGGL